jgi:outer membrane protein assembly factor BamB
MMIERVKIVFVAGALLFGAVGGVAWYRHSTSWKSASSLDSVSNDRIWWKEFYIGSGWSQVASGTHEVVALEAATGRLRWKYIAPPNAGSGDINFSGLLSTAGGLVFGASGRIIFALDADTGREVWHLRLGGTTKAAPISFTVDGRQVVALAAGRALFVFGL